MVVLVPVLVQGLLLVTTIAGITPGHDHGIRDVAVVDIVVRDRVLLITTVVAGIVLGRDLLADVDTTTNCRRKRIGILEMDAIK